MKSTLRLIIAGLVTIYLCLIVSLAACQSVRKPTIYDCDMYEWVRNSRCV